MDLLVFWLAQIGKNCRARRAALRSGAQIEFYRSFDFASGSRQKMDVSFILKGSSSYDLDVDCGRGSVGVVHVCWFI